MCVATARLRHNKGPSALSHSFVQYDKPLRKGSFDVF